MFLRDHPIGRVFAELDAPIRMGSSKGDIVYRPDIVFVRNEHLPKAQGHLEHPPDLVVEVISPDSGRYDAETKKHDCESAGVAEYWLIDPDRRSMTFLAMKDGRYVESTPDGDVPESVAIEGFSFDLGRVRECFEPW